MSPISGFPAGARVKHDIIMTLDFTCHWPNPSPGTIANLRHHPVVEINVVDPVSRKGYRFKGPATIHQHGPIFEQGLAFFRQRGTRSPIHSIVLVRVERAIPLISPAYDQGKGEEEIRASWLQYWTALYGHPEDRGLQVADAEIEQI